MGFKKLKNINQPKSKNVTAKLLKIESLEIHQKKNTNRSNN
jgi:hypothetical protein